MKYKVEMEIIEEELGFMMQYVCINKTYELHLDSYEIKESEIAKFMARNGNKMCVVNVSCIMEEEMYKDVKGRFNIRHFKAEPIEE